MTLGPNIQLEAAFVTPEGQRVIELWKKDMGKEEMSWSKAYDLWHLHFGHISLHHRAFKYWRDNLPQDKPHE